MKALLLLVILVSSYSLIYGATGPCLYGAAVCVNHELVAKENGQTYCCQSGYKTITTKLHTVNGFSSVECHCLTT
ncbi:hypothetical protein Bpfe_002922 [Biomphalaria pfeifferi]|uniref:Uncharacterized protein n=1 Tax=Biomphalaria pfeifferi TaxID=112525 RepID=A0AAD8FK83_BIOPF|nr:hypothetical protein Bpfe_002922 [Biomphalaria pfeifferi]